MKFTIKRNDAADAVKKCLAVSGRGKSLPILSCIRIDAEGDEVTMTATDLDRWIVCRVPAKVEKPGSYAFSGRLLSGIFSAGDEAAVEVDAKMKAVINCGGSRFRFSVLKGDEMPAVPTVGNSEPLTLAATAWLEASRGVAWAASTEETRASICGVLLEQGADGLIFVATDGRRLCRSHTGCLGKLVSPITIPNETVISINAIASNGGDLAIGAFDGMITAACGSDIITSKLVDGCFPNYRAVIPDYSKAKTTKIKIPSKVFIDRIGRLALVSTSDSGTVNIDVSPGAIAMMARTKDDEATASMDVEVDGPSIKAAYSGVLLGQPFRKWDADEIEAEIESELSPLLLRSGQNLCVIMPMRVQ